MNQDEMQKKWAEIVAKAWSDEAFKKQLKQNPKEVFKEYGFKDSEVNWKIVENTKNERYLVLPEKPEGEISEEQLKEAAGGYSHIGIGCKVCSKDLCL